MRQFWSLLACFCVAMGCQTTTPQPTGSVAEVDAPPPRLAARSFIFMDVCKNPNAEPAPRFTVGQLKNQLAIDDCDEAWNQLQKLDQLDLTSLQLSDISPLTGLIQLRVLRLGNNQIQDLKPLEGLGGLDILQLNDNQVQDLRPLDALKHLRVLDLGGNGQLKNLEILRGITGLRELYLSNNNMVDISVLADLRELKVLDIGHNKIESIKPLQQLTKLEWLDASENGFNDLSPLQKAKSLWYLSVAGNRIESVDVLGDLNLREIYLQGNRITSLKPLLHLRDLQGLAAHGNPVDRGACPRGGDVPAVLDEFCEVKSP